MLCLTYFCNRWMKCMLKTEVCPNVSFWYFVHHFEYAGKANPMFKNVPAAWNSLLQVKANCIKITNLLYKFSWINPFSYWVSCLLKICPKLISQLLFSSQAKKGSELLINDSLINVKFTFMSKLLVNHSWMIRYNFCLGSCILYEMG